MTKYLYILIGILLVAAAAVFMVGYLVRQASTTPGGASTPGGNAQPVNNYTVGVSTGNQSGQATTTTTQTGQAAQTYAAPDYAAAYTSILISLGAQPVSFSQVQSTSDSKFGGVYALYKNDIAIAKQYAAQGQTMSVSMASADLNNDGTAEVLAYEDLPGFCGSGGCSLDIYAKVAGSWKKLYSIVAAGEVGILNSSTAGYQDLAISTNMGTDPRAVVARYAWNGSTYAWARTLAVWNGQRFVPLK